MKEKLRNLIQNIKLRQAHISAIVGVSVLVIVAGVFVFYSVGKGDSTSTANDEFVESGNSDDGGLVVAVVGEEDSSLIGSAMSNNSWAGEIISLNNLQIQPDSEGTISEWYVRIGESVYSGQVMGRLSRPPQMPDVVMALSEKSQMLREASTSVEALRAYTAKRILQLKQLRTDTESSNKEKIDLLRSDTSKNNGASLSLIASKKKLAQVILRGSISRTLPIISYQTIPELSYNVQLKWSFGVVDSNVRNSFAFVLSNALSDLKDIDIVPEKSGLLYFDTVIKLANSSITGEMLSEASLESLKQMLIEDQVEFVTVLGEIKSMELERANVQRESIDTLAEIDAMIIELEKELAMSEGELVAKEVAYASVRGSVMGGYSIVAPKSGVVSSIMKKPGEFVGPGMPVALVTAKADGNNELVRMRIPNNTQKPKVGELLSIVRPGFSTDVQKARLVGVGSSLDTDGSYMADAVFMEPTKWSIGASVIVLTPASSSAVFVKHSSVFWSKEGVPTVWVVSQADRIFSKKIAIGRTLGVSIEVYEGLKNGDRYIVNPTQDLLEDAFLGDIIKSPVTKDDNAEFPAESGGHENMPGM